MYFGVIFVYPFDGGVETVAVVGGYFERGIDFLFAAEEVFANLREGPALIPGGRPRVAGFANPEIGN